MKSIGISVLINISVPSLKTSIWLNYLVCSITYNMQCKEKILTNLHFGILFTLFHSLHYTMLHTPAYGTYNVFTKLLFVWHGGRNYNKWHRGSLTDTYCWWWLTMLPIYKSQKIKTKQNCIASIDSLINNSHVDPKDYYSVHVVFETSGTLELVTL